MVIERKGILDHMYEIYFDSLVACASKRNDAYVAIAHAKSIMTKMLEREAIDPPEGVRTLRSLPFNRNKMRHGDRAESSCISGSNAKNS